jgi:hypothetical protein
VSKYFEALKNILIPRICFICEAKISEGYLCQKCLSQIDFFIPRYVLSAQAAWQAERKNIAQNARKKPSRTKN